MLRRESSRLRLILSRAFGPPWRVWGTVVLAALLVGCGAGALWLAPSTPNSLTPADTPEWVPVTPRAFDDRRTAQLSFTRAPTAQLHAPIAGTVTSFNCSPGTPLQSGSSSLNIDGARILSLATAVPLWRDLGWGDQGEDVSALQKELGRLGFPLDGEDGTVGAATFAAVNELFAKRGDPAFPADTIPSARFLWLPSPSPTPHECLVSPGAMITPGEELARFPGTISSARIDLDRPGNADGERIAEIDGQTVPVGSDGIIVSTEALEAISASPSLQQASDDGETVISVSSALATPVKAYVVPPPALVALDEAAGCVVTADGPRRVTVVGSELGQSFITFDRGKAPDTVALAPEQSTACE